MDNYQKINKLKLIKHSSVYWFGAMLSKVVGFFLIPLYTHYLNPAEYGKLELITLTADVFALFIGMQINIAVFKAYSSAKKAQDKNKIISSAVIFIVMFAFFAFLMLITISDNLSYTIFNTNIYSELFILAFIGYFFAVSMEVPMGYLRVQDKSALYVLINIGQLVVQVGLSIFFVAYMELGILGVFLAPLIAFSVTSSLLVLYTLNEVGTKIDRSLVNKYVKYSLPLIPGVLAMFVINFSDRFILSKFVSVYDIGIYSLAYKFGILISQIIILPFNLIWQPKMFEYYAMRESSSILSDVLLGITILLVYTVLGISLLIEPVLMIMTTEEFLPASKLVPIISLSYMFSGLTIVIATVLYAENKTKWIGLINTIAALFCVLLNFAVIPRYGVYGAAYSTFATFLVIFILNVYAANRIEKVDWGWRKINLVYISALLIYLASVNIRIGDIYIDTVLSILLLICFLPLLIVFGVFSKENIKFLTLVVTTKLKIKRYRNNT